MKETAERRANRLSREKSPYLLQHQFNPVDWYSWGDEAFARARREEKPIFLSIGYSTCHWCHVMERESFENDAVAAELNAHFISIKVDREERPDLDKIYMTFVQAMTGQGGWPLSAFLTPDLKPFYGGTYFPPEGRFGRPGFVDVLRHIHGLWTARRGELLESAEQLTTQIESYVRQETPRGTLLGPAVLERAGELFMQEFDAVQGGYGRAPKFPRPSQPLFLLRYARRTGRAQAIEQVLVTCARMAAGGIRDQLGGGFHRYSVDAEWLVPHFEKMLYDNAQLVMLYLDAYLISGERRFAEVIESTIEYVLRDMTHPDGGFYSAEDADSEGKEGKFYCWTRAELSALLTPEEFNVATRYFGVTDEGNFVDHSDPSPLPNQNVLSVANPEIADADRALHESAIGKMRKAREGRVRPHLDDKVLASWNGMMLGAMARAGVVLGNREYLDAAEKNFAFLRNQLWDSNSGRLRHRWRGGSEDSAELLDSYANLLDGTIELYQATLKTAYVEFAIELAERMIERFFDPAEGGFWQSPAAQSELILRIKDDYDGAEPSGNSVAALALLKLAKITGRDEFHAGAERTLKLFAERLQQLPQALPHMLLALDLWMDEPVRVVIAGDPVGPKTGALLQAAHSVFQPRKVVLSNRGPVDAFSQTLPEGPAARAYMCTGTSCLPPEEDPARLAGLLKNA